MAKAKTLADVPAGKVFQAQQAALMRLQLYLIGRTHQILVGFGRTAREAVLEAAGEDGALDSMGMATALGQIRQAWTQAFTAWRALFEGLRINAAAIPLGTLAILHREAFAAADLGERRRARLKGLLEADPDPGVGPDPDVQVSPVFKPQLQQLLDAAAQRVYGDGLQMSQRIWRTDNDSISEVQRIVYEGIAKGDSAWNIAKRIEEYLGPGQDCPRWTRSRLYGLTKPDIAGGSSTGLYTGDECDGQGVAYYALRLARNEIQIAHHMATDMLLQRIPWIDKEQINLSPSHPVVDICDDVVAAGERGEGIYEKGEILLPLHPQCICYKTGVMMPPDEFSSRLRGWLHGGESWPEMDEYASWMGVTPQQLPNVNLMIGMAQRMVTWLWGDEAALDAVASMPW